jgi:hypothetical protein
MVGIRAEAGFENSEGFATIPDWVFGADAGGERAEASSFA